MAVTGSTGRLGRALVRALAAAELEARPWSRPEYDLDVPSAADALLDRDRPGLLIHCAAWTDVDGCARDPALAFRRNATAVSELAISCHSRGTSLVLVSTNEVFDGRRADRMGYVEGDATGPINPYGESKLAGEQAARAVYDDGSGPTLWIARTSWLYGPPGADFPHKILAAAARLPAGAPLRVVADEFGSPTYTEDLADAIVALVRGRAPGGTYHLVNAGYASRAEWAERVLAIRHVAAPVEPISQREFQRASSPPLWGVLDSSAAAARGVVLRPWQDALDDYLAGTAASR
ncbi:MAG: NAD(P)-dependent oxidoreductase [Chloroflexi bacterium]|nr:NAD(P)-dependent oxidoreductase [Chloroflexota bacterium]